MYNCTYHEVMWLALSMMIAGLVMGALAMYNFLRPPKKPAKKDGIKNIHLISVE